MVYIGCHLGLGLRYFTGIAKGDDGILDLLTVNVCLLSTIELVLLPVFSLAETCCWMGSTIGCEI